MPRPTYPLKSVDNALILLSMLQAGRALKVSAAADELGVAPSTAHRLLSMLVHRGFAEQDTDKSYRAVSAGALPQASVLRDARLQAVARPELLALGKQLHETVHLMVLTAEANVEFIESIEAQSQTLRVGVRVGTLLPAHLTSGGKAMLAELRPHELASYFPDGSPSGVYPDLPTFERYLNSVRMRGYASNFEETERGVNAMGACIRSRFGNARAAAVTVSAPAHRLLRSSIPEIGIILRTCARRIEDALHR